MKKNRKTTSARRSAKKRHLGKFKSGLEFDANKALRSSGLDFEYEPKSYIVLEDFSYEGDYHKAVLNGKRKDMMDKTGKKVGSISYTPDFVAKDESWFIETKGTMRNKSYSQRDFPLRWRLFLKWLKDNMMGDSKVFICKDVGQVEDAIKIIQGK